MSLNGQKPRMRNERKCGAEALRGAYLRLGRKEDVNSIWSRIATEDRRGNWAVASYQIAADAIHRGYDALTLRAKHPAGLLDQLQDLQEIQWIVCHRLRKGSSAGHFSLLENVHKNVVQVYAESPTESPDRAFVEYDKNDFLDLWTDQQPGDEFRASVVIGICKRDLATNSYLADHPSGIPAETHCLRCKVVFTTGLLRRLFATGVTFSTGQARQTRGWAAVFCPYCDAAHR